MIRIIRSIFKYFFTTLILFFFFIIILVFNFDYFITLEYKNIKDLKYQNTFGTYVEIDSLKKSTTGKIFYIKANKNEKDDLKIVFLTGIGLPCINYFLLI
jgi:hypothetical protein